MEFSSGDAGTVCVEGSDGLGCSRNGVRDFFRRSCRGWRGFSEMVRCGTVEIEQRADLL